MMALVHSGLNVVSLSGAPPTDASAEFQRVLAGNIEAYVDRFGREPEGFVFVLSDGEGNALPAWLMRGACEGRAADKIATSSLVLSWALRETDIG